MDVESVLAADDALPVEVYQDVTCVEESVWHRVLDDAFDADTGA